MQPKADQTVRIQPIRDSLPLMRDIDHACWQRQDFMVNLYKCSISVITKTQLAIQIQVT